MYRAAGRIALVGALTLALLWPGAPGIAAPAGGAAVRAGALDLGPVDCATISTLGIDKQMNARAALIRMQCGLEKPAGDVFAGHGAAQPGPDSYGGADVQVNDALADAWPHVTQSTTFIAARGDIVVVAYNSSTAAASNYSGYSYSDEAGTTFTEIRPSPFATGHGTNFGDPVIVYSPQNQIWYTFWLTGGAGDCGAQGIGAWSSGNLTNWSTLSCVHVGTADDRQSGAVDASPTSPYYGRLYVAWNDFANASGSLVVATSTDSGTTWSAPVVVHSGFIRQAQITTGPDGTVYSLALDEGGGGANPRQNYVYVSTDGGATWGSHAMGAAYPAPGAVTCGYFRAITPIWRHMGYGQPGVGPDGTVHYVYTAGAAGDEGDIYYVRSTDHGTTWSAPLRMNTDGGTRAQWMPSLAVTANGRVLVSWYDRRNTADDSYQRYARASLDNGVNWEPDEPIGDVIIPQPAQPDPNVTACYAGDYDVAFGDGNSVYTAWTDGRVSINSTPQQDVYLDKIDFPTPPVCQSPQAGPWTGIAPLPAPRRVVRLASDGFYLYAAGGYDAGSNYADFLRYNPRTSSWSARAPLPDAISSALAVYNAGKIYVFGGYIPASPASNKTRIYNIATDSWSYGADMPAGRGSAAGGYYDGKIYIAGGFADSGFSAQSQTWAYDIASNAWSTLADMPAARGGTGYGVIRGHLYVVAGTDAGGVQQSDLYDYDISANSWSTGPSIPNARYAPGSAVYGETLWVFGGGTPFLGDSIDASPDAMARTAIYDRATNTWATGPDLGQARVLLGGATAGNMIIAAGGYDGAVSLRIVETPLQRKLSILLAYADAPDGTELRNALLAQPGVSVVDLFNARIDTPSPDLLRQYDLVVVWSNLPFDDAALLGDRLADYQDEGGAVVAMTFAFTSGLAPAGRWAADGYSPFDLTATNASSSSSLGTIDVPDSPLMAGVSSLTSYWRSNATLTAGTTQIARWSDGLPAIAVKGQAAGVTGYFGDSLPMWSGYIARLIANAGFALRGHQVCSTTILPAHVRNFP